MNRYLVDVSVKANPDGEFRQRMVPTVIDEQHLLQILSAYVLVKGRHLNGDGMVAFYSAEGIYPLTRLLVLDQPATDGHAEWFDILLSSLPIPVVIAGPLRLPGSYGVLLATG